MKSLYSVNRQFKFGSFIYDYNLLRQDRKTLSLTVTPDLNICVKTPNNADDERIELFLRRKWLWLEKQLKFFGKYKRKKYQREYISGESFHYLGRQHRLIVKNGSENKVAFIRGILSVLTIGLVSDGEYNKALIEMWIEERISKIFNERFEVVKKRFDYKKMPKLGIREMKRRWGSFLNKKKVLLNPKLIHMPKDCIDYVITHELCHMRYKNHDKKFFALLYEKYPKWQKTKEKLEEIGALIL